MKIKKVVAFGCSWTYGEGLVNPKLRNGDDPKKLSRLPDNDLYRLNKCYAGIVASYYRADLENYACFGASLESMRWSLIQWIKKSNIDRDVLLLVGLTDATRQSWFNPSAPTRNHEPVHNKHIHSTWLGINNPEISTQWNKLQKLWLGMSYHQDWAEYNFQQTVDLFDHANSRYGIPVIQYNVLNTDVKSRSIPSLIDTKFVLRDWLKHIEKYHGINCFVADTKDLDTRHPNEYGHKLIANYLIDYIDHTLKK